MKKTKINQKVIDFMVNDVSNGDKGTFKNHFNADMLSSIHANMFPEGERATGEALVYIINRISMFVCMSVCLFVGLRLFIGDRYTCQ